MFKNIRTWTQKKLKAINRLFEALYIGVSFMAPILTIIIMVFNDNKVKEAYRFPIISAIVAIVFIAIATRFFKKKINEMKILNMDGTYDVVAQTSKHNLQLFSDLIIPGTLLVVTIVFATFLKEAIDFYMTMISICLSFFVAGIFINRLCLEFLQDELNLRDKVAEANAIDLRRDIR